MLHSLVGSWHMQPLKIHYTALPQHLFKGADSSNTGSKLFKAKTRSATTASAGSRSSGGGVEWPRGLRLDADGSIAATLVRYEQTAKPKGEFKVPVAVVEGTPALHLQQRVQPAGARCTLNRAGPLALNRSQACRRGCGLCRAWLMS